MKKKLLVTLLSIATVMALAVPAMAFAVDVPSPQGHQGDVTVAGTTVSYDATGLTGAAAQPGAKLQINEASYMPTLGANQQQVLAFNVTLFDANGNEVTSGFGTLGMSVYVGNYGTAIIYHEGHETQTVSVSNGYASWSITQLSNFAIAVDTTTKGSTGTTSPKTGADTGLVALAAGTMLLAAAGVALVYRKRTQD